jgi:hypothetical protein
MLKKSFYKIFKWDSRNTGFYVADGLYNIVEIRKIGKLLGEKHYTLEGENGWFEEYKNGEKVSWSCY